MDNNGNSKKLGDDKFLVTNDKKRLANYCAQRITGMWKSILDVMIIALPHSPGDGSENEKKYSQFRSIVLGVGNDTKRDILDKIEEYTVNRRIITKGKEETHTFNFTGQGNDKGGEDE